MDALISVVARNAMLNALAGEIGASAKLRVYAAAAPEDIPASVANGNGTNTLLAELTCNTTFAPAAANATLTPNAVTGTTAVAGGSLANAYYRVYKADGITCVRQGTAGKVGTGKSLTFEVDTFVVDLPVNIASWTITL